MGEALLVFSLGPVQSFIAEARRTQDLWAGSLLLSQLMRAALRSFREHGAHVIYPALVDAPSETETSANLPNKCFVRVDMEASARCARAAEEAVRQALRDLAEKAALEFPGPKDEVWWSAWRRQIDNHLEVYWAAAPLDGDYAESTRRVSRLFAACKRTRWFAQCVEDGEKDSLSGTRSALHTSDLDGRTYWRQMAERIGPPLLHPRGSERLDALGLLKRFGQVARRFDSTSTVASRPFLRKAERQAPESLRAYRRILERVPRLRRLSSHPEWPYDGDLLFVETLSEQRLRQSYGLTDVELVEWESIFDEARHVLRRLYRELGEAPSPYFVTLVMDGDNMGRHVSSCRTPDEHEELSLRLSRFSAEVATIVTDHLGSLVYSGGDDVLALLPVSTAVDAALALREAYRSTFADWRDRFPLHEEPFTCSAGLAVSHHLSPLGTALREARQAENRAKALEGKDAISVTLLKRSGESVEATAHWSDVAAHFPVLRGWFSDEGASESTSLSRRLVHEAADRAQRLPDRELFLVELKRLVLRQERADAVGRQTLLDAIDRLGIWMDGLQREHERAPHQFPHGAEALANWLAVAAFVERGGIV